MSKVATNLISKVAHLLRGGDLAVDLTKHAKIAAAIKAGNNPVSWRPAGQSLQVTLQDGAKILVNPRSVGLPTKEQFERAAAKAAQRVGGGPPQEFSALPRTAQRQAVGAVTPRAVPRIGEGRATRFLPQSAVVGGGRPPLARAAIRRFQQTTVAAPATTVAGATLGAMFFGDVVRDATRGVGEGEDRIGALVRSATETDLAHRLQQQRLLRTQAAKAENIRLLALLRPDIYNPLLAGRPLAIDSVPIGGEPRIDFVDQVAGLMAEGYLSPEADPAQELLTQAAQGALT